MRVLIVSQYYWPESFQINDIAKVMAAKGVQVEVLTGQPNYPAGEVFNGYSAWGCKSETHEGVVIHRIPLRPRGNGVLNLAINYLSYVLSGLFVAPFVLRKMKYDVIFVYGLSPILQAIPAIFLGWLHTCPKVLWVQDLWPESLSATGYVKNAKVLKAVEYVVRFIYRRMDLLLVQSEAFIVPVSAFAGGTPVRYHPNAVDDSFSTPATGVVPSVAGLDNGFSVLFAGNIGRAQAVDVIIEAATLLRDESDIHFVVMGEGSMHAWMIEQQAERQLLNLHLPGRFPVENMPAFMQKASVLLVTLSDEDILRLTVPSKVQAYLAAGRPIIACLNGEGARLVAKAEAGLTVQAQDAKGLAAAVLRLYRMAPEERAAMGRRGSEFHVKNFSHDMLVDRLIGVLDFTVSVKFAHGKIE
jgi:glycosyltransferase involved in cell wall biosynthesis